MGILGLVLPEIQPMRGLNQGPYHHLDVLSHSFETLRQFEALIGSNRNKYIGEYFNIPIAQGRSRLALVKLGAFLHDAGKPRARRRKGKKLIFHGHERIGAEISEASGRRLRLSNNELDALKKMVLWHLRPGYLADNEDLSRHAIFRFFRDTSDEAVSVLLISLADQRSTRGPLTTAESRSCHERLVARLIREYFKRLRAPKPAHLVNGNDLIRKFKLTPSPLFGEILSRIEELQAVGKIKNRHEALEAVKKLIHKGGVC